MSYLVIAYRYGTRDYSFPIGIFSSKEEAKEKAQDHREYRGWKYDHKLFVVETGKVYDAEDLELEGIWITGEKSVS